MIFQPEKDSENVAVKEAAEPAQNSEEDRTLEVVSKWVGRSLQ